MDKAKKRELGLGLSREVFRSYKAGCDVSKQVHLLLVLLELKPDFTEERFMRFMANDPSIKET